MVWGELHDVLTPEVELAVGGGVLEGTSRDLLDIKDAQGAQSKVPATAHTHRAGVLFSGVSRVLRNRCLQTRNCACAATDAPHPESSHAHCHPGWPPSALSPADQVSTARSGTSPGPCPAHLSRIFNGFVCTSTKEHALHELFTGIVTWAGLLESKRASEN